jgi:aryl-alcohol dehydrogenase-like predicted oxidoreductase
MTRLGSSDIDVFPLCLGGNVFGWTANEAGLLRGARRLSRRRRQLHRHGRQLLAFVTGQRGGESETIIGNWTSARGREHVVIATKVAKWGERPGLSPDNIRAAIDDSLRRLQSDYVDLYYAHADDPNVETEAWYAAFDELVQAGKVRALGLSNFTAERVAEVVAVGQRDGLAPIAALRAGVQPRRARGERSARPLPSASRSPASPIGYWRAAS